MGDLKKSFVQSGSAKEFASHYLKYLQELLDKLDIHVIDQIAEAILTTEKIGKKIYFIGNGGSAAIASHFTSDIMMNTTEDGANRIQAICLSDNIPVITTIANDYGYEDIFIKQLEIMLQPQDVVLALSVSGNSENIIKAIEFSKTKNATTIGCTGFDGGRLRKLVDISLHIPTNQGEYGLVEDIFQILDHLIYSYIRLKNIGRLAH